MGFDYFYGQQADQFTFYRVPKVLFTEKRFGEISADAKMLYGILLDRMSLSAANGWLDDEGRVYIIFTIEDIKRYLGCADKKAVKLLDELEQKCGLIERKRQGLGKPNLIYVKNFISSVAGGQFLNRQKDNSGTSRNTIQGLSKGQGNYTDFNNTEISDTDPFLPSAGHESEDEGSDAYRRYYEFFYEKLDYDILLERKGSDFELLQEILDLIVDTVCSRRKTIRIASDDKPTEIVRSRFMKLNAEHITYVMDCLEKNTTKVRNIRQYLLAAIYNAPSTMDAYYAAAVRHDFPQYTRD